MSYILDALTKSDQQRQSSAAPDLRTVHAPAILEQKEDRRGLQALALASLLLASIASVIWLNPRKPENKDATAQPLALQAPAPKPAAATDRAPWPQSAVAASSVPETTASPAPRAPLRQSSRPKSPEVARADRALPPPAQPATTAVHEPATAAAPARTETPAAESKVLNQAQMPASVQKEIPKISISGFSRTAEPNERMVIINDRVAREGDEVANGLKVEKILADGVVFNYKGYRFRSGVF